VGVFLLGGLANTAGKLSAALCLAATAPVWMLWGWAAALGLWLGWLAAAAPMIWHARLLPKWIRSDEPGPNLKLRLLVISFLKYPLYVIVIFFTTKLGLAAAASFVGGATSVYLALAAGAVRSLRSGD
jgi:hypothetical protein